jgi:hypothetical protein
MEGKERERWERGGEKRKEISTRPYSPCGGREGLPSGETVIPYAKEEGFPLR